MPGFLMVAPVVTAQPGLTAQIVLFEPNVVGSCTYSATQADLTTDTTQAAALSGDPVVTNGTVTLTATTLIDGHDYAFEVTVTGADGMSARSAASTPITATT